MIHKESWYREAIGEALEREYYRLLGDFLRNRRLVDLEHLGRLAERGGFEEKLIWDVGKKISSDYTSEEEARIFWDISDRLHKFFPILDIDVWYPRLSDSTPGGVDLDVLLKGKAEGEITLYRGGRDNEWGSWGEGVDHWMSQSLIDAIWELKSERLRQDVINVIVFAGSKVVEKSGIEVGDTLMQETDPQEDPEWGEDEG